MYYLDFLAVSLGILAYGVYAFWSSALMLISVSDTPTIPSFGSRHIHHCVVSYKPSQYPYVLCSSVFSLWLVLASESSDFCNFLRWVLRVRPNTRHFIRLLELYFLSRYSNALRLASGLTTFLIKHLSPS